MTTTISRRHHYIPQFYLKGFTNDQKKFAVYDIKKDNLKKGLFSPKTHFFEFDRNVLEIRGKKTDFLEVLYSKLDTKVGPLFNKIQSTSEHIDLDAEEMFILQLFVSALFWRIPRSDRLIENYFRKIKLGELGFEIIEEFTGESASEDAYREILNDPNFRQSYRPAIPLISFMNQKNPDDLLNWKNYYHEGEGFHICGDNPVILKNEKMYDTYKDEFIFPLTKNKLLVYTKNKRPNKIDPEFLTNLNLVILLQSKFYVCSPREDYLRVLSCLKKMWRNHYSNDQYCIEKLKNELFKIFD
jgi:hypothetical protein